LISEAPRPQLSEIEAQVTELKRLLNELEKVILLVFRSSTNLLSAAKLP
jgi:hypothetical protein